MTRPRQGALAAVPWVLAGVLLLIAILAIRSAATAIPAGESSRPSEPKASAPSSGNLSRLTGGQEGAASDEPVTDIGTSIEAGLATWFDSYGPGLYAAVPSYSWGDPHYQVTVCRQDDQSRCVVVTVLDCLCGGSDIVIDLSRDAFARLEDPARGKVAVTVESSDGVTITQPPTDVDEP